MRIVSFNTQATSAIQGRKGAKLRLDVKDGTLMVRPTDRKAGPHILTEMSAKGKGVQIEITDKHLEKLGAESILTATSTFGLRPDKYGWFALTTGDAAENEVRVDGGEVSVSEQADEA